jgi:two-component system sensor histidine kinase QseC
LLGLAVWWAVYSAMAPLRRLGRMLAARQPQALLPVTLQDSPSEMAPLVDALNGLFERIARLMDSERRFTADAAHELRTPLAAIRAQAQVAMGEADEARRRAALEATLQGCDRAARLVEQLLTLSRLESGAAPVTAAFDLAGVVRQVLSEMAPRAIAKEQEIELDAAKDCRIEGDPTLVAVLVRNLADNAIRYSPARARVKVSLARRATSLLLTVEDSGPGMQPADAKRLGERFFRVMGSGEVGSGLGWSIVRRIAQVHGAAIRTDKSAALGGLAVQVEWPARG